MDIEHSENQLADTLSEEPEVFMGCTATEITTIAGVSAGTGFVVGVVLFFLLLSVSPSLALLGGFATFLGGGFLLGFHIIKKLGRIKEQRGVNYYKEVMQLRTNELLGMGNQVFNESRRFSRGKSL